MPVSYVLGQEIVDTYRDIDEFMRQSGGPEFVDIDIAGTRQNSVQIWSHAQARKRLAYLSRQVEPADPESQLINFKLRSTAAYLGYIANPNQPGNFDNTIRRTLGFKPFYFPDQSIQFSHALLDAMMADYGRKHDVELGYSPQYFEPYHTALDVAADKLAERAHRRTRLLGGLMSRLIVPPEGVDLPSFGKDVSVKVEAVDAPWVGYMTTDGPDNKLTYIFNSHSRHRHTPAGQDMISFHEMIHLAEFGAKQREIAEGRMNPVHGITTFHGPEILQAEFNAQVGEHLLADTTRRANHRFQSILNDHFTMVWNNAHIDINRGMPTRKVMSFLRRELPLHTNENLAAQLKERTEDLNNKIYLMSYSAGIRLIIGYFQRLPLERRAKELGVSILSSRTYDQMSQHYESLV
jgi:hypothetical protein